MSKDLLVVEDESAIREMVKFALYDTEYILREAADVRAAQVEIAERVPDLVLLDWMLPGTSGLELARELRRDELTRDLPIIMLTAKAQEDSRIKGLEAGVDDYVTKPFSPRELLLRIRAVLRRGAPDGGQERIEHDGLLLDEAAHRVYSDEGLVTLGPTEFRLLKFFMTHPERVYSREQILDRVWGRAAYIEERTVDVHIRRLRKALTPSGHHRLIQTVRSAGYRFSASD